MRIQPLALLLIAPAATGAPSATARRANFGDLEQMLEQLRFVEQI